MATLLELTANIVSSHVSMLPMTTEELLQEIRKVHTSLLQLETTFSTEAPVVDAEQKRPTLTIKQAFRQNEVICMICGKGGMKTLARHLNQTHQITPRAYRKQFGIPKTTPLTARKFTEVRKELARNINLSASLAKAREARMANIQARKNGTINV